MNNDKNFLAQSIRAQYTEKKSTSLDELYALDKKVKRPANLFGYLFGTAAALIMGSGMSLVMTDIGSMVGISDGMTAGIIVGVIGLTMALINYPIFKQILSSRKKKYADEIIKLSDKIINN